MKVEYILPDQGESYPDDAALVMDLGNLDGGRNELHWARECAENYHHQHDGWEASWPVDIALYIDGVLIGVFEVEREAEPVFIARKKEVDKSPQPD